MKTNFLFPSKMPVNGIQKNIKLPITARAMVYPFILLLLSSLSSLQVSAATYYSGGSLPANLRTSWWTNTNATGVNPPNFTGNDSFIVQSGHTMTTTANWTLSGNGSELLLNSGSSFIQANGVAVKKLTVSTSATFTINSGRTLTVNNGNSAVDLNALGTITNSGNVSISGTAVANFGNGSNYIHNRNGGNIPTATWHLNSNCEITGCLGNAPGGLTQTFGNFTWNSPQTSNAQLAAGLKYIAGNFQVLNTGTFELRLTNNTALTLNIGGDMVIIGANVNFASAAAATKILNLSGNYKQEGGAFTNSNTIPLAFNFVGSNQSFLLNGTMNSANINWKVNSGTTLLLSGNLPVAVTRNFTVNGTLNCGTGLVEGAGSFTLASGATLIMSSPEGITTSGATGNIQVTGSRSYNTGASYVYNSASANPVTGNGLPATVAGFTVNTLSVDPLTLSGTSLTVTGNITISNGSRLEIGSTKQLTVNGTSTMNGAECLLLKSDLKNTASFISNGTVSGAYTARAERFITNDFDWHFLSSPVNNQPMWPEFVPTPTSGNSSATYNWAQPWLWDMYYYNANCVSTGLVWVNMRLNNGNYNLNAIDNPGNFAGFGPVSPPVFTVGRGYMVAYSANWNPATGSPETHKFTGTLNSGSLSKAITNTYTPWNLVGNPYPSALDFHTLYSVNSSKLSSDTYYIMLGDGTYASYSVASGGVAGASRYIASMQGFYVVAASNNTLSFTNAMRAHNTQLFLKNSETFTNRLSLKVRNDANTLSDEVLVHFDPEFIHATGAEKMFSFAKEAPNMYTLGEAGKLTINQLTAFENTTEIPLCVAPGVAGNYTIEAFGTETFDAGTTILLTDFVTGTTTNLSQNKTYTFTATPADNPERFKLHFETTAALSLPEINAGFNIYTAANTLTIENNTGIMEFQLAVFDINGREQFRQSASGQLTRIPLQLTPGMYIVKVVSKKGTNTEKVVVR